MSQFPQTLQQSSEEVEGPFYKWLSSDAQPDDWHRFALGANWDMHDPKLFEWIVAQPTCDKATALAVFWKSSPDYAVEHPEKPYEYRDLINLIRSRWGAGCYSRSELDFDPETDAWFPDFKRLADQFGARIDEELPMSMRQPLKGRRLTTDGDIEGIPRRFWPEDIR